MDDTVEPNAPNYVPSRYQFGRVDGRKYIRLQDKKGQLIVFQLVFFIDNLLECRMTNESEQSIVVKFAKKEISSNVFIECLLPF